MPEQIRVFIGSGREHWLPAKVLEFSIRRRTQRDVKVMPMFGAPLAIPMPVDPKQRPVTSFSFQRFIIPELCGFEGKGIYLDSDQIVLADIAGLWETPIPEGASAINTGGWQSAVMLIDNRCGWKISDFVHRIDIGSWTYKNMMNLSYPELRLRPGLDPLWNVIDRPDPKAMNVKEAKLLHYTDMNLQPWLYAKHPHGARWSTELIEAVAAGFISVDEVLREIEAQNVRPSLALLVDEEPPYEDERFVYPDRRRKAA